MDIISALGCSIDFFFFYVSKKIKCSLVNSLSGQNLLQEFPRNKQLKYFLGILLIFFIRLGPA